MQNYGILRQKLERNLPVTLGYIGGSITMAGEDTPPTGISWRARTTTQLMAQYPHCPIQEVNGGISGTGSDFAVFRAGSQVLCHKPDMIFIEFTVNDGGTDPQRVARAFEGLLRKCRTGCPEAAMMVLLMLDIDHHPAYWERGEEPPMAALHQRIAEAYGIPVLHNGRTLYEAIRRGALTREEALSDAVHPRSAGHAVYAQEAFALLTAQMEAAVQPDVAPLPARLDPLCWETARLYPAALVEQEGFLGGPVDMWGQHLYFMVSHGLDSTMRFTFTGRVLGVFWIVDRDAGQIEVQIDGGAPRLFSAWDSTVIQYPNRLSYAILADDLPLGIHEVTLRTVPHLPESSGDFVRIESFMLA